MAAITWRALTGIDQVAPVAGLSRSADTLNQGFNILDRVLQRQQGQMANEAEAQRNAAQQGYLDLLQGATSVDALNQLRASGALQQAYEALDPRVRAQVRGAEETRMGALRDQTVKGQQYDLSQKEFGALPVKDQISVLTARGDYDGANALVETLPEGSRGAAMKAINDARYATQDRQTQATKNKAELERLGLQTQEAQQRLQQGNLQLDEARRTAKAAEEDRKLSDLVSGLAQAHQNQVGDTNYGLTDTQAFQNAMRTAREAGFSNEAILRAQRTLSGNFDRALTTAPVGADARALEAEAAKRAKTTEVEQAESLATSGAKTLMRNAGELGEYIKKVAADGDEARDLTGLISKYANGFVKDGKTYDIPLDVFKTAIAMSKDDRWYAWWSNRSDNADNLITKMMNDPKIIDQIVRRGTLDQEAATEAAKKALKEARQETKLK